MEANRETCGLCQSLIGGLQVELRRLINGFYLLHLQMQQMLLCQTLQDMSANGEADYLEAVHAGGQTRQTVQSSSLLRKAI